MIDDSLPVQLDYYIGLSFAAQPLECILYKWRLQKQHPARADAQNSLALLEAARHGHFALCQLLLGQVGITHHLEQISQPL